MDFTTTNVLHAVEIGVMITVGLLAFMVGMRQTDISDRLLKLEETNSEAVLSIKIGEYQIGNYQGDKDVESLVINPIFKNTGLVPISIIGSGFNIDEPDNFGRTFITYTRGQSGIAIASGAEHTLRYELRAAEDKLQSYRFDIIYKKEPDGKEKCMSLILLRGKKELFQISKKIGCPEGY